MIVHRGPPSTPPGPFRLGCGGGVGHQLGRHRGAYAFAQCSLVSVRRCASASISTQCQAPPGLGVFSELRIAQVVGVGQLLRHADEIVPRSRETGILSARSSGLRPTLHEKTGRLARLVVACAVDYNASWSMPRCPARGAAPAVARRGSFIGRNVILVPRRALRHGRWRGRPCWPATPRLAHSLRRTGWRCARRRRLRHARLHGRSKP